MYFLAGADIFDGLTWLRFAFENGQTVYKQNFGATNLGVNLRAHVIDGLCWNHNYRYMQEMELDMRRFLKTGDYGDLRFHGELFRRSFDSTMEAIGGSNGR